MEGLVGREKTTKMIQIGWDFNNEGNDKEQGSLGWKKSVHLEQRQTSSSKMYH